MPKDVPDMQESLAGMLHTLAREVPSPRGGSLFLLAPSQVEHISKSAQWDMLDVEQQGLGQGIIPERYVRNMDAIDVEEQRTLLQSRIAMVGLGGLGGHLLELLARTGIGTIVAADGDAFEASNLNRQLLATSNTLHQTKASAAQERCRIINPATRLHVYDTYLDEAGMLEMTVGADIVVDALGELAPRRLLSRVCRKQNLPLVAGALAGWSGYVALIRPGGTHPVEFMGGDDSAEKKLGCPGPTVAFVASLMAAEVINTLVGRPTLDGRMLALDLRRMQFETVTL